MDKKSPALYACNVPAKFYSLLVEKTGAMANPKVEMAFKVADGAKGVVRYPAGAWTLKPNGVATKVADWIPPTGEKGEEGIGGRFYTRSMFLTLKTKEIIEKDLKAAGWTGDDLEAVAAFYSVETNHGKPFQGLGAAVCQLVLEPELSERKRAEGSDEYVTVARLDRDGHFWPRNAIKYVNGDRAPKSTVKNAAKGSELSNIFAAFKSGGNPGVGSIGTEDGSSAPPAVGAEDNIPF